VETPSLALGRPTTQHGEASEMANRVVSGKFTGEESVKNPLADGQLMKKQSGNGRAYGEYLDYSVETRKGYKSPKPRVENTGNAS